MNSIKYLSATALIVFLIFSSCSKKSPTDPTGTGSSSVAQTNATSSANAAKAFFSAASFWNRPAPTDAVFSDIQDVLLNDPAHAVTRLYLEIISVLTVEPSAPSVNLYLGSGWAYPDRATPTGSSLAQFHLADTAGVAESTRSGNGHFAILDQASGTLYQGIALWRDAGSSSLLSHHFLAKFNVPAWSDYGSNGYRGAGFSALGGMIRSGEMSRGIPHALAVLVDARKLYSAVNFTWPASKADTMASDPVYGYLGTNAAYKMGSLLLIPKSVNLSGYTWKTTPGRMIANCARDYGLYVSDDNATSNAFAFAMETSAIGEIGLTYNPVTGAQSMDPAVLNYNDFFYDVRQTLTLVKAVVNNHP